MIMSQDLYTLQRWARYPNEDFAEWLPKYPTIDGVLFEYPLVWSLPEGISAKWYWKESIKEYLQLHGYNMTVNADNDDLDAMVKHVQKEKLPLLTPKGLVSDIVLEVGDIVRGQMEVVDDFSKFRETFPSSLKKALATHFCAMTWTILLKTKSLRRNCFYGCKPPTRTERLRQIFSLEITRT